jgi:hypothetical protein
MSIRSVALYACEKIAKPEKLRMTPLKLVPGFLVLSLFVSEPAMAIQSHPAPEGLYVHQIAHLCFIVAMGFLAYWLEVNRFTCQKGWRYIQIAAILFLCWNVIAFFGHWVEEKVPKELFIGDPDWSQRLVSGESLWADCFYVLKLDHLVCVPAIIFLYVGIKRLYMDLLHLGKAGDG